MSVEIKRSHAGQTRRQRSVGTTVSPTVGAVLVDRREDHEDPYRIHRQPALGVNGRLPSASCRMDLGKVTYVLRRGFCFAAFRHLMTALFLAHFDVSVL
jgi:hypothetical protein